MQSKVVPPQEQYRVLFFGTGSMADEIIPSLQKDRLEIQCFLDERPAMQEQSYWGKAIRGLDALSEFNYEYILIACKHASLVARRLEQTYDLPAKKLVPLDFEEIFTYPKDVSQHKRDLSHELESYLSQYPGLLSGFDINKLLNSSWIQRVGSPLTLQAPVCTPPLVLLELTSQCNMTCPFCPFPVLKRPKKMINQKLAYEFLDGLYAYGYRGLSVEFFLLGEPLLVKNFPDYIQKCLDLGFHPNVFTNGLLINGETARTLYNIGARGASISLHVPDSEQHKLRTTIPYQQYLDNIFEFLFEWYTLGNTRATVYILPTDDIKNLKQKFPMISPFDWYDSKQAFHEKLNIFFEQLDSLVTRMYQYSPSLFVEKLAATAYHCQGLVANGQFSFQRDFFEKTECRASGYIFAPGMKLTRQPMMLWAKQEHFLRNFLNLSPSHEIDITENHSHEPCIISPQIALLSNGEVTGCCLDFEGENSFGNLNNVSIQSILDSKRYRRFLEDRSILQACRRCTGEMTIRAT